MATENKKNTDPKKMHYIPNFYLKLFADENHKIWVYDRVGNKYWNQLTSKVARIKNYYAFSDKNGIKNYSVDRYITDVENATKFILDKINKNESITMDEKITLSIFLALLQTRIPEWEHITNEFIDKFMKSINKRIFNSPEATKKIIDNLNKSRNKESIVNPEEFFSIINNTDSYKVEYTRENIIPLMINITISVSQCLVKKDWIILNIDTNHEFITSDNPFILIPSKEQIEKQLGIGVDTPGVKKFIPLSSNRGVTIFDDGFAIGNFYLEEPYISTYNKLVARDSKRFIFSKSKRVLEDIVGLTKIDTWQKGDRIKMGTFKANKSEGTK